MMLEGAVMQAPAAVSSRKCLSKSWNGVERCNRGLLASTSSRVSKFSAVIARNTAIQALNKKFMDVRQHCSYSCSPVFIESPHKGKVLGNFDNVI